MSTNPIELTADVEIRELLNGVLAAARSQDIKAIGSAYTADVVAFDAIGPLQFKGRDAYVEHWSQCLAMCPGPAVLEMGELELSVAGNLAVGHYLLRCGAVQDGGEKASWMRVTVGLRKENGRWRIFHEHGSAPFDPATGKALLESPA